MPYSVDPDLSAVQRDILPANGDGGHGYTDWAAQHIEAESIINRDLQIRWWKGRTSSITPGVAFDPAKLLDKTPLTRLSVYKTLELVYLFLRQDSVDDPFQEKIDIFKQRYEDEFEKVLALGLIYDWDGSGSIESNEALLNSTLGAGTGSVFGTTGGNLQRWD